MLHKNRVLLLVAGIAFFMVAVTAFLACTDIPGTTSPTLSLDDIPSSRTAITTVSLSADEEISLAVADDASLLEALTVYYQANGGTRGNNIATAATFNKGKIVITISETKSLAGDMFFVSVAADLVQDAAGNKNVAYTGTNELSRTAGFILVDGGTFQMGSNDGESNETPVHQVTVSSFYMKETEVTNEEYAVFLNAKGVSPDGSFEGTEYVDMDDWDLSIIYRYGQFQALAADSHHPVVEVTWDGAKAYSEWLGGGLPTEAEWEYAARGGAQSQGSQYSGSNDVNEVAWYGDNSGLEAHPVGGKKANELGLYDMSGNIWEWCSDWYGDYSSGSQTDPQGASSGSKRVFRGGSWAREASYIRVARRNSVTPDISFSDVGFRVVLRTR